MNAIAVFGSVFVDVKGFSAHRYVPTGRNVGDVIIVHGGVSRNVAEDMANIGIPVSFVTMLENTGMGEDVRRGLEEKGVDMSRAVQCEGGMGMWLAVMDEKGDLAGSISRQPDFAAMDRLVDEKGDEIIAACDAVVLEIDMTANIAEKVVRLAEKYGKDVYVIVGNMDVIERNPDLLKKVRLIITNEIEAGRLFQCETDKSDVDGMLKLIQTKAPEMGLRSMVITLGEYGAVYFDGEQSGFTPAEKTDMIDSTGAGDAFFSGTVAAHRRGFKLSDATVKGTHLASCTLRTDRSTCPVIADFFD